VLPAATVCPASQRDRVLFERAADPLHRAGVNSKLFGNDADTAPPRSRQSLTDSLFQCGGDWGTPKAFTLTPALSDRIGRKPLLLLSCGGYIILAYPLFMMASSGSATLALIAQMVMIVFLSFFSGACPAVYSEILPTRVRYTALSIGYNIAVAVFGGFAPFIATWLIGVTGSNLAPSYYLIAAATITFLVVLRIPETAFEPLR
jgi:MFS family permease